MDITSKRVGSYTYFFKDKKFESLNDDALHLLFDIEHIKKSASEIFVAGGRGSSFLYTTASGEKLVYRHYMRGGFVGRFIKDLFFLWAKDSHRAYNEMLLLDYMQKKSLPVPKALISRERKCFCFIKQDLIQEQIENTQNLCQILCKRSLSYSNYQDIIKTIMRLYKANVVHTDLNIKNILIDDKDMIYIIDFDKCYIKNNINKNDLNNMFMRLLRSFEKERYLHIDSFYYDKDTFKRLVHSYLNSIV